MTRAADPIYIPLMSWNVRPKGRVTVEGVVRYGGGSRTFYKECNNTPQAIADAKRFIELKACRALKEFEKKIRRSL